MPDPLPIAVCVPLSPERTQLFELLTLPSIRANNPAQIITDDGLCVAERWPTHAPHQSRPYKTTLSCVPTDGNANVKRNRAASFAEQPFLFFCDDDVILEPNALSTLLAALEAQLGAAKVAYAYCDYAYVNHPTRKTGIHTAGPFDANRLRQANFVSTMSVLRTNAFSGFDPSLQRLQDYDLWLTLLERGLIGTYIHKTLFTALYGVHGNNTTTRADGFAEAMAIVRGKHGLT